MKALRSFFDGLLKPSLLSVVISLCLATTIVLTALFALTPQRLVPIIRWHQQYAFDRENDAQLITADGLELLASGSKGPGMVLLGGSTLRESIDVPYLRQLLAADGQSIEVHDLSFSAQRMIDSIALVDLIPPDYRGVVVVSINPGRVGRQLDVEELIHDRRVGILGETLIDEARYWPVQQPVPTGIYAWDNRNFLLGLWKDIVPVLPGALFGSAKPIQPTRHFYLDEPLKSDEWLARNFERVTQSLKNYDALVRPNLEALERLHQRLSKRGLRMVLLENPVNPRFVEESMGAAFYARHIATMRAFAAHNNIPYFYFTPELKLQPADFHDWAHFRTRSAQFAYTQAFETRMSPLFKQEPKR